VVNFNGLNGFTIEAWINADTIDTLDQNTFLSQWGATVGERGFRFEIDGANGGEIVYLISTLVPRENIFLIGSTVISTGTFFHVAVTVDHVNDEAFIYVNGVEDVSNLSYTQNIQNTADPVFVGSRSGSSQFFDGLIDEVRISDVVRSSYWILTEFNNQNDPSTFHTLGAEEKLGMLICTLNGTFITEGEADPLVSTGASVTSAVGECNSGFGTVGSFGLLTAVGVGIDPACVEIKSVTAVGMTKPSPSIIFNQNGDSILFEITTGEQCFFDANGVQRSPFVTPFCATPASIHFSETTADFVVISEPDVSRFQSTGIFDDATGSGTIMTDASHCDRDFPLANFFTSTLTGMISVP